MDVKFVLWARTRVAWWVLLLAWNVLVAQNSQREEQFTKGRVGLVLKVIMREKEASSAGLVLWAHIRMNREKVNVFHVHQDG